MTARRDAAEDFTLLAGDAHVWHARLDRGEPGAAALAGYLARDEQQRASRFRFHHDRHDFIIARGLLRLMIGRYLSCPPESVAFVYGPHGKPSLASDPSLHFNVAHSNRVGLFAFARGTSIGIDVEYVRPLDHDVLAARFFSPVECAALERVPRDRRREAFFRCWTRKEAYIKALGGGLSIPLDRFDVSVAVEPGQTTVLDREQPDAAVFWTVHDVDVGDDFRAAVAVKTGATCVTVREVPLKIT